MPVIGQCVQTQCGQDSPDRLPAVLGGRNGIPVDEIQEDARASEGDRRYPVVLVAGGLLYAEARLQQIRVPGMPKVFGQDDSDAHPAGVQIGQGAPSLIGLQGAVPSEGAVTQIASEGGGGTVEDFPPARGLVQPYPEQVGTGPAAHQAGVAARSLRRARGVQPVAQVLLQAVDFVPERGLPAGPGEVQQGQTRPGRAVEQVEPLPGDVAGAGAPQHLRGVLAQTQRVKPAPSACVSRPHRDRRSGVTFRRSPAVPPRNGQLLYAWPVLGSGASGGRTALHHGREHAGPGGDAA